MNPESYDKSLSACGHLSCRPWASHEKRSCIHVHFLLCVKSLDTTPESAEEEGVCRLLLFCVEAMGLLGCKHGEPGNNEAFLRV